MEPGTALAFELSLNVSAPPSGYNRLLLSYAREAGERFYGFGMQYSSLDAAGSLVPILCVTHSPRARPLNLPTASLSRGL